MRVLILGGTVFLGRHIAAEALGRGHAVTLFHRGRNGTDLFTDAEHVLGDRTVDLGALGGREWDAVVDTSGYEPAHVAACSRLLAGAAPHLLFVSTLNVYPDWPATPIADEDAPVSTEDDNAEYGPAKAACERAAGAAMGGRVTHLRSGLLCGPYDFTFRLPWWVQRVAAGGRFVAPGTPDRSLQLIDARDPAAWALDLAEQRVAGAFNATGPAGHTTWGAVLDAARAACGSDAEPVWRDDAALTAAGVEPWSELPLWLPQDGGAGAWQVGTARAQAAGLRCRPIADTITDTWAWLRDGGAAGLGDWHTERRATGLTPEHEAALLASPS